MHSIISRSGSGSAAPLFSLVLIAGAALHAGSASAATVRVMNCSDSGAGSLRETVARANSGDVIDLRRLGCGRIVLTSGAIQIAQLDLTLVGPGRSRLVLDGNNASRVLVHDGDTLVVRSMTIANGRAAPVAGEDSFGIGGGCIRASGNLHLFGVDVHHCRAVPDEGGSSGGGVFALFDLRLVHSNLFSNVATNGSGGGAAASTVTSYRSRISNNSADLGGGGLDAGEVSLKYSTVDRNRSQGSGGGISAIGRVLFIKSTVSNNRAARQMGGGVYSGGEIVVVDSTFSGNKAVSGSAIMTRSSVRMTNSTIAFNRLLQDDSGNGGALEIQSISGDPPPPGAPARYRITSSIIARNLTGSAPGNDFGPDYSYVAGRNNLIERAPIRVPADTLSAYPRLAPLAYNGGPTRTHALLCDSPAIDRGSNPRNRMYDQRGPGFPRVAGRAPDIGAFERRD